MAYIPGGSVDSSAYTRTTPEGTPLPVGIYKGIIVKTEQKQTSTGGIMVVVEFDITAPPEHSNRKFWDRFNLVNSNPDAVRIAKEAIADLAQACGLATLEDDEQLIGREVIMELAIEPAKPYTKNGVQHEGKPQNKCKKYWPVGTDVDAAKKQQKAQAKPAAQPAAKSWNAPQPAAASPAPQQAAPATTAAPWKRNKQ